MKPFTLAVFATYIFIGLGLSSCGVKPPTLQPPENTEPTNFPRQYPIEMTDKTIERTESGPKEIIIQEQVPKYKGPTNNRKMTGY